MSDDIVDELRNDAKWFDGQLGRECEPGDAGDLLRRAADEIERLRAWQAEARAEFVDIRSQWGDDYIWRKYNERFVLKLLDSAP